MILGIDIGNYALKVEPNINVKSLVTEEENILGSSLVIEYDNKRYALGEGTFESELNKSSKENILPLLFSGIALKSNDKFNQVVVGLPINQFKTNKDALENLIESNRMKNIILYRNGQSVKKEIIIDDIKVYPEGIGAYYSLGTTEDKILVDIGGRTTDIAYITGMKNTISSTVPVGTLSIYKAIIDKLNSDYSLSLDITMAEKILIRNNFKVDGRSVDLSFITSILKTNFMKIKEDLDFKFPARSEDIVLVGGGANLFNMAFKKRYSNCIVAENPIYCNAIGFRMVGEKLWL